MVFSGQAAAEMSGLFKIATIEGKGFGWIAIADIEKGSLILNENSQIFANEKERPLSANWIKSVLKSFEKMSQSDQNEYLTLYDRYDNIQLYQNSAADLRTVLSLFYA